MLAISGLKGCYLIDRRRAPEKWARVHFIHDLKIGVFVTLCPPDVIKEIIRIISGYIIIELKVSTNACKILERLSPAPRSVITGITCDIVSFLSMVVLNGHVG